MSASRRTNYLRRTIIRSQHCTHCNTEETLIAYDELLRSGGEINPGYLAPPDLPHYIIYENHFALSCAHCFREVHPQALIESHENVHQILTERATLLPEWERTDTTLPTPLPALHSLSDLL